MQDTAILWCSLALKDSINKSNAAMLAAMMRSSKGKGKERSKLTRDEIKCTNTNCGRMCHTQDHCFMKGGEKEREAPEWFKKLAERKSVLVSVNVMEKTNNNDSENYVMLTYGLSDDPTALILTSDFKAEADTLSVSNLSGITLDSGASRHFSPECSKLLNFKEIDPEPIRAADGRIFSVLGKGELKVNLLNRNQKPTLITLTNVYYSPHMAFTLMSVSCVDKAGFSLLIKGGACVICSSKSNIIG